MSWDFKSDRPIYTQLVEQIELMIFSDIYPPGSRLPPVRDMAQEAAVNPNTMQRALSKLEEDGLIVTHRTSGRSVTEDESMIKKAKNNLALDQIAEFLENMRKLGIDRQEVLKMIAGMAEEAGK